jgi:hypothetical protein
MDGFWSRKRKGRRHLGDGINAKIILKYGLKISGVLGLDFHVVQDVLVFHIRRGIC